MKMILTTTVVSAQSARVIIASLSLIMQRPSKRQLRFLLSLKKLRLNRFGLLELRKKKAIVIGLLKNNVDLVKVNKKTDWQIILAYVSEYIRCIRELIRRILLILEALSLKSFLVLRDHSKLLIHSSLLLYVIRELLSRELTLEQYADCLRGLTLLMFLSLTLILDLLDEGNYFDLSVLLIEWMLILVMYY